MHGPGKRGGQPHLWQKTSEDQHGKQCRTDEAMQEVVDRDRAGSQLSLFETSRGAGEQSEIGHKSEAEYEPTAAVVLDLQNGGCQQREGSGSPAIRPAKRLCPASVISKSRSDIVRVQNIGVPPC